MTKKPYTVEESMLATDILFQMNRKKSQMFVFIRGAIKEKLPEFFIFTIY